MSIYQEKRFEQQKFEFLSTAIYVGYAAENMTAAQAAWTIKKITLVSGNPTQITATAPYTAVWDDRATETYG